jgi:hypothetical protein
VNSFRSFEDSARSYRLTTSTTQPAAKPPCVSDRSKPSDIGVNAPPALEFGTDYARPDLRPPFPRSRGGHTTWDNVVTACSTCNLRKGGKSPAEARMWPGQMPYQPSVAALHNDGRLFLPNYLHQSGLDYLYWDTELEP